MAERGLSGVEDRYRLLVQAVIDYALYMLDPEGLVATWNPGAERIKGYRADEIIGKPFALFFTEEDRQAGRPGRAIETARREGRFEDEGWRVRKDGTRFWAMTILDAIHDPDGRVIGFAKVTRDISERKRVVDQLAESERRFRLLVDSVKDYAIFMLDRDGVVANWNSGAERIKGYTAAEIVGRSFRCFYPEEDREAGVPDRALAVAAADGRFEAEGWRLRKDGTRFWANVVIQSIIDETGELIGFAKVTRDVTERRESQLRLEDARQQLFQAQKMEAVGQLTGGIAHDFNNLLTVILGGTEVAYRATEGNVRARRMLDNVRLAAERGEALTKQLLAFSRRQPLHPRLIDLRERLQTTAELIARSLEGRIELDVDLAPDLWPVEVDPNELDLALLNIAVNARDAMPDGGRVTLRAANIDAAAGEGELAGPHVAISLRDTGVGIPLELQGRVFEPFFTTKGVGRGTGLGLSQSYGFARQSGGTLRLDSAPGRGTTVTFLLPARPGGAVPAPGTAEERRAVGGIAAGRILVVEDDPHVAVLTTEMLRELGHDVHHVGGGLHALSYLRGGANVDLVFSDIRMPGSMNGIELAREIRTQYPHLPVLLTTGYSQGVSRGDAAEFPLIRKPYRSGELSSAIARLLAPAKPGGARGH